MISEKIIYNTFLKTSRSKSGLPYRLRKQWHGFENTPHYAHVLKLKNFFGRNRSVDMAEFFEAPYTIYPGESGFDLDFYSSQKAIKIYTLALRKKMLLDPDDQYHLNQVSKGLKFILRFCQENNIGLNKYLSFTTGVQRQFVTHLKDRKISIYNLFAFTDFDKEFKTGDADILRFTLSDIYDNIDIFRTKYLNSRLLRKIAEIGLAKVEKVLQKEA